MDRLIELIAIALVASLLSLLAVLALDIEIKQDNRDLESFRSQGFSLSHTLSSQGEGVHEQLGSLNTK